MNSPLPNSTALAETIDTYIEWLVLWHRLAFITCDTRAAEAHELVSPDSFSIWFEQASTGPAQQPALEKISAAQEQLHTLARLVLMKTPDGKPVTAADHDSVITKYRELIQGLRRMERAFATASSGLDLLTGLRSRVGLKEDLWAEHSRFLRNGRPFCVALMDIDHFKSINDRFGHDAGDRVLASVADHISRQLRPFDDAYRWGGEEFLLCLKEADLSIGLRVLERLRVGLEKTPVRLADGTVINLTASFGCTVSLTNIAPDMMPQHADAALYRAKNEGRNRVITADIKT